MEANMRPRMIACMERDFIVPKGTARSRNRAQVLLAFGPVHVCAGAEEDFGGIH
jgi:hypothetical protein